MAEKLDPKELVPFEELLMANSIQEASGGNSKRLKPFIEEIKNE